MSRSRAARTIVAGCAVAACVGAALAGCTASETPDPAPTPSGPRIEIATVRGALLQPADIGPTWAAPARSPAVSTLVSICGGDPVVPAVPGRPAVTGTSLADEGQAGAQTLDQTGLVYADAGAAQAALGDLRAVADACPASVEQPARDGADRREPGYTETVQASPLNARGWSGFVVLRHKRYAASNPGTGDTAVAVLASRNVVLVVAYAVYRLGARSTAPQFTADWRNLVGSVLGRIA